MTLHLRRFPATRCVRPAMLAALAIVLLPATSPLAPTLTAQAPRASVEESALLARYCVTCHNSKLKTAGLLLDTVDVSRISADAELWEKVVRKIRTGMMPPSDAPRPGRDVLDALATAIEARLDAAAAPDATLTTPALHRLNRTEYANAVRDLLALDIDVATLLPADGSSEGFDNIAEALSVSPSLIQGYISAALKISRRAVGDRTLAPSQVTFSAPGLLLQEQHVEGLPLGTRGGMLIHHTFPLDAEYEFTVSAGGAGGGLGGASLDVTLDGEALTVANPRSFRVRVAAGPRTVGLALVDRVRGSGVDEIYSDFRADAAFAVAGGVQAVTITGPFNSTGVGDTPSRRRILICSPASAGPGGSSPSSAARESACARQIAAVLARRAYRGPVTPAEIETLMQFYQQGRSEGDFETGVQHLVARVLVAPRFLYRAEGEPAGLAAGERYRIDDVDLASRLSFFLWSSIPDDELLDLAERGRLRESSTLERQVRRMLADPKSEALVRNLAGQWLYLRELAGVQTEAKNFDDNLRRSFQKETELLFETIIREDRSLLELLDADYTFVDERLARHYGIPEVRGSYFRRVPLQPDSPRRGLLGHGSMLTVTSVATRTSPVSRGKWVLENLLGIPPPVPPPGVETNLDADPQAAKPTTVRERLEAHRANPVCASCHRVMDPIGFALENFDQVGTWRDREGEALIDASGRLTDGTPLNGVADLRRALLSRSDAFMTTAAQKLMTYALGRPVTYLDMPAVRAIVRRSEASNHTFSSLALGIVQSDAFGMRKTQGQLKEQPEGR